MIKTDYSEMEYKKTQKILEITSKNPINIIRDAAGWLQTVSDKF
jgi:hypothetical protein